MTPTLIYILKTNLLLVVIYAFYKLFLQKETYVKANRLYFTVGILLSLLLPLVTYTEVVYITASPSILAIEDLSSLGLSSDQGWSTADTYRLLTNLYLIITVISLAIYVYKVVRLYVRTSRLPQSTLGRHIRIDKGSTDAYSFMGYIILPNHYEQAAELSVVLKHEQIHIEQKHSLDLLLVAAIRHLFWFNPIVTLIQREVNLNLEYIVDQKMALVEDSYTYQKTLVLYQVDKLANYTVVNTFGSSDIKKRIIMLNNPKSTYMKKLKFLLLGPVVAAFFFLFQIEVEARYADQPSVDMASPEVNSDVLVLDQEETVESLVDQDVNSVSQRDVNSSPSLDQDEVVDELTAEDRRLLVEKTKNAIEEARALQRERAEEARVSQNERLDELRAEVAERRAGQEALLQEKKEELKKELAARDQRKAEIQKEMEEKRAKAIAALKEESIKAEGEVKSITAHNKVKSYEVIHFSKSEISGNKLEGDSPEEHKEAKTRLIRSRSNGSTPPLYYFDGVKKTSEDLSKVDASQVKNITVIKGNEAVAKYGEEAKGGVILVELKPE